MKSKDYFAGIFILLSWVFLVLLLWSDADNASLIQSSEAAQTAEIRKFSQALPGYKFRFPEDHYSHNDYKTEWWYYTGHLKDRAGKLFGFELTFFRTGVPITDGVGDSPWALDNVYMTHFALSEISGHKFHHWQKICRPGICAAGADTNSYKVWTENWSVKRQLNTHYLKAEAGACAIDLQLQEGKAPVIQGKNGVSQKASCVGCASHYYSLTRMPASGKITVGGKELEVSGTAWMDHEFGSNQLSAEQIGWDWYSIQLEDNSELMLYVMRTDNGSYDPNSSGTLVNADGKSTYLPLNAYRIQTLSHWDSPHTKARYPARWHVSVPGHKIELDINPQLADQELVSKRGGISYWEGACSVAGKKDGKSIKGEAYVELTGYAGKLNKNI